MKNESEYWKFRSNVSADYSTDLHLDRLQVQLQILPSIIKATKEEEDNVSAKRSKNQLKREATSLQP